jgi:hypothetical protein
MSKDFYRARKDLGEMTSSRILLQILMEYSNDIITNALAWVSPLEDVELPCKDVSWRWFIITYHLKIAALPEQPLTILNHVSLPYRLVKYDIGQLILSRREFSRSSCRRLRKDLQPKDLDHIMILIQDFTVNARGILVSIY